MGAPSNVFTLAWARQSAKGVFATSPRWRARVTGADVQPVKETARIAETGTGRDGGDRYVPRIHVSGGADQVLRPGVAVDILHGILGARSTAGTPGATAGTFVAPYTHTATTADDQPYFTVWRYLGNVLIEEFRDCKFSQLVVSGSAGENVGAALTIVGGEARKLTALPVGWTDAPLDRAKPFRIPGVRYMMQGVRNRAVRDFSLTIAASQNPLQTDEIYDSYIEPGARTIDLTYTEVFQDLALYEEILYGGATAGPVSEDLRRGVWEALFGDLVAGPGLSFNIPNFVYLTAPLTPDPGGDPLQMAVTGAADPPETGSIITAEVVNEYADTAYAVAA